MTNVTPLTRYDDDEREGLTYHYYKGEHALHHNCEGETCVAPPRGEMRRRHAKEKCGGEAQRRNAMQRRQMRLPLATRRRMNKTYHSFIFSKNKLKINVNIF